MQNSIRINVPTRPDWYVDPHDLGEHLLRHGWRITDGGDRVIIEEPEGSEGDSAYDDLCDMVESIDNFVGMDELGSMNWMPSSGHWEMDTETFQWLM